MYKGNILWTWMHEHLANVQNLKETLTKYKNAGFSAVAIPVGGWAGLNCGVPEGTLRFSANALENADKIATVAHSLGLKVFYSVYGGGTTVGSIPNLKNPNVVSFMLNEVRTKVLNRNNDGYIDDIEMEYGINAGDEYDYANWVNKLADLCRSYGKIGGCYMMTPTYPYQTTRLQILLPLIDTDLAVFATHNPDYIVLLNQIGRFPWVPHLLTKEYSGDKKTITDRIEVCETAFGGSVPDNLAGFGVWHFLGLENFPEEFQKWKDFEMKNLFIVTTPKPEPPETEPDTKPILAILGITALVVTVALFTMKGGKNV